jgi:hypothetical protein
LIKSVLFTESGHLQRLNELNLSKFSRHSLGIAKRNGINPNDYLTAVLKRIGNHPINDIDELRPWNIDLAPQPGDTI